MSRDGARVVKNASILMATQLITWALSLLLVVFLPRYLGAAAVGEFAIAGSIWAIMGMLMGFGMDTLLMKEIARNPARTPQLVGTALILRVILFLLSCGVVAIYVHLMAYPRTTVNIIWIIGLSIFITQLGLACLAALQGLEAMHYSSLAGIISKAFSTGLGITVVLMGYGMYMVGFVNVTSALISTALLFLFLRRFYKPQFYLRAAPTLAMCRVSFPYLMSGLGLILYGQVDVLIISSLINTQETGWYGAASQLFGTLLFIPVVFTTAVFPVLTRTYANASDALPKILRKTFDLMLLVSVPIGLGIFVVAQQGVTLLLGSAFTQSGPILALMGIVLIFTYQNILIGQFLISTDRQNSWTLIMIVAAAITVPLDLILVPWCQREFGNGAIAGALSFIVTELGMVFVGIWLLPKGSLGWSNGVTAIRIIIAGLAMVGAAWWARDMFIAIPVIVGTITYIGMIAILRVVPSEDIMLFKEMAQGIMRKLRQREPEPVGITGV
jgi:O-antigen/teichoic acid export membrane protein